MNCRADIDGSPAVGWSLWHSHLGDSVGAMGGMVTKLPPYTASPLAFWVERPAGATVWNIRVPGEVVHQPAVPPPTELPDIPNRPPQQDPPANVRERPSWIERMSL